MSTYLNQQHHHHHQQEQQRQLHRSFFATTTTTTTSNNDSNTSDSSDGDNYVIMGETYKMKNYRQHQPQPQSQLPELKTSGTPTPSRYNPLNTSRSVNSSRSINSSSMSHNENLYSSSINNNTNSTPRVRSTTSNTVINSSNNNNNNNDNNNNTPTFFRNITSQSENYAVPSSPLVVNDNISNTINKVSNNNKSSSGFLPLKSSDHTTSNTTTSGTTTILPGNEKLVARLYGTIETQQGEFDRLQYQYQHEKEQHATSRRELETTQQELSTLQKRFQNYRKQERLVRKTSTLDYKERHRADTIHYEQLSEQVQRLQTTLKEKNQKLAEFEFMCTNLQQTIDKMKLDDKKEIQEYTKRLDLSSQLLESCYGQLSRVEKELSKERKMKLILIKINETLQNEIKRLQEEIHSMNHDHAAAGGIATIASKSTMLSHKELEEHTTQIIQDLQIEDALFYFEKVKKEYEERPKIYRTFLDIIKNYKSRTISTPEVIARISKLFHGKTNLIIGFNRFLPNDFHINEEDVADMQGYNKVAATATATTTTTIPATATATATTPAAPPIVKGTDVTTIVPGTTVVAASSSDTGPKQQQKQADSNKSAPKKEEKEKKIVAKTKKTTSKKGKDEASVTRKKKKKKKEKNDSQKKDPTPKAKMDEQNDKKNASKKIDSNDNEEKLERVEEEVKEEEEEEENKQNQDNSATKTNPRVFSRAESALLEIKAALSIKPSAEMLMTTATQEEQEQYEEGSEEDNNENEEHNDYDDEYDGDGDEYDDDENDSLFETEAGVPTPKNEHQKFLNFGSFNLPAVSSSHVFDNIESIESSYGNVGILSIDQTTLYMPSDRYEVIEDTGYNAIEVIPDHYYDEKNLSFENYWR